MQLCILPLKTKISACLKVSLEQWAEWRRQGATWASHIQDHQPLSILAHEFYASSPAVEQNKLEFV